MFREYLRKNHICAVVGGSWGGALRTPEKFSKIFIINQGKITILCQFFKI